MFARVVSTTIALYERPIGREYSDKSVAEDPVLRRLESSCYSFFISTVWQGETRLFIYFHECPVIRHTLIIGYDSMVLNSGLQFL